PEILRCCDGERDLAGVVTILAERFAAPADEIMADVSAFLDELRRQHLVVLA
ncbi:MAG: PqqD family protein, partial [Gluconacetobacter diazotrophicus]|nr:PqqD family protein [Gluconacetobacter diazotrophicus]